MDSSQNSVLRRYFNNNSASTIMKTFNPERYAQDNSKQAQEARARGARKPYYLEYEEKRKAMLNKKDKE